MPTEKIIRSASETFHNTRHVTKQGFRSLWHDPSIMAYPLLAALVISLTWPIVNVAVISLWHHITPTSLDTVQHYVPKQVRVILGIVTLSYFYSTVIATYFICAVSAAVTAKLDGHPTTVLHGLTEMMRHFWRISRFAILAVFFVPLAFAAQYKKLPRGIIGVIGSSFSIHTAQMAPAIIDEQAGVFETIRKSVNTLGVRWREGLFIKVAMYGVLLALLFGSRSLPRMVRENWFHDGTANLAAWLVASFLTVIIWVTTKVLGAVFITALYHHAANEKTK